MRSVFQVMVLVALGFTVPALAESGSGKIRGGAEVTYEYDADEAELTVCIGGSIEIGPYGIGVKVCESGDYDGDPLESPDLDIPWIEEWILELCEWICMDINIGIIEVEECTEEWCFTIG